MLPALTVVESSTAVQIVASFDSSTSTSFQNQYCINDDDKDKDDENNDDEEGSQK